MQKALNQISITQNKKVSTFVKKQDLRKGIKIKAYAIFLSWLMIFAHSIIPHNHAESDFSLCHGHKNSAVHHTNECSKSGEFHDETEDTTVCRILNLLFHHFNQDNLIIQIIKEDYFLSSLEKGSVVFDRKIYFYKNNFLGSVQLRAPPLA